MMLFSSNLKWRGTVLFQVIYELGEKIRLCYQIYLDVGFTQTLVMHFQISSRKKYLHKWTLVISFKCTLRNGLWNITIKFYIRYSGGTEERIVENKLVSWKHYFDTYSWN